MYESTRLVSKKCCYLEEKDQTANWFGFVSHPRVGWSVISLSGEGILILIHEELCGMNTINASQSDSIRRIVDCRRLEIGQPTVNHDNKLILQTLDVIQVVRPTDYSAVFL